MNRTIAMATLAAGTLDILYAMMLTVIFGRDIGNMLRFVGSGPYPGAVDMGAAGAVLGLLTHFILMLIMTTLFVIAARERPAILARPIVSGIVYGLITYVAMNWIVVPVRFDTPLPPRALSIATQLFAHIALVGIPMALIAAKTMHPKPNA